MNSSDAAVAFEISRIEREDVLDRVDISRGNQASVIDFNALDSVAPHNLFPSGVDRWNVRQQS